MTRRLAIGTGDKFDLFPYIGLLMCFLGALLLTTLGMASLSLGPNVAELWHLTTPCCNTRVKAAVLVEWDGKEATVHAAGGTRRFRGIDPQAPGNDSVRISAGMRDLIAEFGTAGTQTYPLFAVRPSGFETFRAVAMAFRMAKVDIGFEPVGQDRPVRLASEGQRS